MSEYQYYEFQAIDHPLDKSAQGELRALSSRARITATNFTNSYRWSDFKGDPEALMERWFDLHLYLANWGTRRLSVRLPERLVDRTSLENFIGEADCATVRVIEGNLILDIERRDMESDGDWDDGSGWLAALAPLRTDLLSGDQRLLYLLWLTAVEDDVFRPDTPEPMPGIGPMTGALEAFATFFRLDPDLVQAAAERPAAGADAISSGAVRDVISRMTDRQKTGLLTRLFEGDPHTAAELRTDVRTRLAEASGASKVKPRTVGELLARAKAIGCDRERAVAEKAAAEREELAQEAARRRRERLDAIARRGEGVWRDVEAEIERSSGAAYDKATALLRELGAVAAERDTLPEFTRRLREIRERHARKSRFLDRLSAIG